MAISEVTKASTLSAEVMRRLKLFPQNAKKEEVEDCICEYMDNPLGLSYTLDWQLRIATVALVVYKRILK